MDQEVILSAQKEILHLVREVSKEHPEGEKFFDSLDSNIIEKASNNVYLAGFELIPKETNLVLSGGFGKKIADGIDNGIYPKFPYILFSGGIRLGGEIAILRKSEELFETSVFFDDSIYGGATYYKIKDFMNASKDLPKLNLCICIYDGCPVVREEIKSIFRYYDYFIKKPNFKF